MLVAPSTADYILNHDASASRIFILDAFRQHQHAYSEPKRVIQNAEAKFLADCKIDGYIERV